MNLKVPASVMTSITALGLTRISQENSEFWAESERLMIELKMLTGKSEAEILESFSRSPFDFHKFAQIIKGRVQIGLEPLDNAHFAEFSGPYQEATP